MVHLHLLRFLTVLAALMLILAACGADEPDVAVDDPEEVPDEPEEEEPEPEEPEEEPEVAWEPEDNVELIVPFGPGGGYDAYSRQVAEVASANHLPDGVRIDVANIEGAAGRTGADSLRSAETDGYTIGMVHNINLAVYQIQAGEEATIDVQSDFDWIGGVTDEPYVLFSSAASGIESVDDLETWDGTLRMGAVGAASPTFVIGVIASDLFDLELDYVTAYPGAGDALTGAVRGDFEISAFEASSIFEFVEVGDLNPLLVFGNEPSALMPDTPTVDDIGQSDAVILSVRPLALPPGSPPEVAEYWTGVLEATLTDPDFTSWSEETGREASWSSPDEVRERVDGAYQFMLQFEDRILEEFERVGE